MNERIKLPAQEWLGYDPEQGDIHGYTFEQMREFAQLIVRECVGIVADAVDHREPASTYVGKIKQHFGVEE